MSDVDVRELERIWRASASWDDWERWARATRFSEDPDPWRLVSRIQRLTVLELRKNRIDAILLAVERRGSTGLVFAPLERKGWLRRRVNEKSEAILRRIGFLGLVVPTPPLIVSDSGNDDIRAVAIRWGLSTRGAIPYRAARRAEFRVTPRVFAAPMGMAR